MMTVRRRRIGGTTRIIVVGRTMLMMRRIVVWCVVARVVIMAVRTTIFHGVRSARTQGAVGIVVVLRMGATVTVPTIVALASP